MKKIFLSLVIFSLFGGLAYLFFKSIVQVSPLDAVLLVDKRGEITELSVEDSFVIKPQIWIPGQIQVYRIPMVKKNFDMRLYYDPPLIQVAGLFEQMKIRLHLYGTYIPIRGKMSLLYKKFRGSIPDLEQDLKKEVQFFFAKVISELFQDAKKFQELGKNGSAALTPALARFRVEMAALGMEIPEIKFGLETNIPSFSNFYLNVYNSPQVVKLLKEKTVEILTLKNQKDKEKAAIELNEKLKLFQQEKELERLKIVAEFLKKYPEAYKVMVLEKIGKNVRVMVVPEMEKFPNIFRLLEEKSLQKKGEKGSGSTLKPGEFLEH
jgi:hypothetical protein